jgi:hypothetical protein
MPAMSGMPKFAEAAQAEDTPGDYGIHPTFAHGGEYRPTQSEVPDARRLNLATR